MVTLAVSILAQRVGLNAATVALILHTAVLATTVSRGIVAGFTASLVATGSFSFFLHPEGSWRVDDPTNWIALGSFLVASTLASQLVTRARQQASMASVRQRELGALYRLSVELFATTTEKGSGGGPALTLALSAVDARAGGVVQVSANGEPRGPWGIIPSCGGEHFDRSSFSAELRR